jgi:hypothetical protein
MVEKLFEFGSCVGFTVIEGGVLSVGDGKSESKNLQWQRVHNIFCEYREQAV